MSEIKEKADELLKKHKYPSDTLDDLEHAILSVEYTIEVLEELSEATKIQDLYESNICDAIDEQQLILTELKSRI